MDQNYITARRARNVLALTAGATLLLGACGSDGGTEDSTSTTRSSAVDSSTTAVVTTEADAAQPSTGIVFEAGDYLYHLPASVPGGWQRLTLDNQGSEEHQLTLARLADGQDPETVGGQLDRNDLSFLAQATLVGAPDGVGSGQQASVITDLEPGGYVAFCAVPSPSDGVPHHQKGMHDSFTVGPAEDEVEVPAADGTVEITPSGYQLPDGFTGNGTFEVKNSAASGAEMAIMRLAPDATEADVVSFLTGTPTGPPPFTIAGGVSAMAPGSTAYLDLDLDPGNYLMLSFVPDPTAGFAPQFTNGVITSFTIA